MKIAQIEAPLAFKVEGEGVTPTEFINRIRKGEPFSFFYISSFSPPQVVGLKFKVDNNIKKFHFEGYNFLMGGGGFIWFLFRRLLLRPRGGVKNSTFTS